MVGRTRPPAAAVAPHTMTSRPVLLLATVVTALMGVLLGLAEPAAAHSGKQSYVYLNTYDDGLDGRVEYPARDLGPVLGIDFTEDPAVARDTALDNADAIRAYTAEHLELGDGDATWTLSFDDAVDVLPVGVGPYIVVPFAVEERLDSAPRELTVTFDGIIHTNDQKDAFLLFENDWGTAVFQNEAEEFVGFSVGRTTQAVVLEDVSTLSSMAAVRGLGTDAVRTGVDHLLFVVALLLPVGLLVAGGRLSDPAPSVESALRRAGTVLGVYAVAHSITLWVVGLGGLSLPDRLVTSLVAASLLVAALYAVWPFTARHLALVAVLGVVQGLGFGLQFDDLGLDRRRPVQSLIAFNVGIEIAVLVVAALTLALLLLLRRTPAAAAALYGGAGVLAAYAVAWLVERVGDSDLDIERVANPWRVWPRNFWIMLVVIGVAAGLYSWSTSRGKLRPVERAADHHESDDESQLVTS